jgi:hypothetical protein
VRRHTETGTESRFARLNAVRAMVGNCTVEESLARESGCFRKMLTDGTDQPRSMHRLDP